jgi:hypothetical protein
MIQLSDDQKFQVLLAEMAERYNAAHKIRERSTQFTLWLSGFAIGLAWLLVSQSPLSTSQRIGLTLLIAILFCAAFYFIVGLGRGFRANREAMVRVERALGMYDSGVYFTDSALLPPEYGLTNRKWSHHFFTLYVWLAVTAVSLLYLTWTRPLTEKEVSPTNKIEEIKGGKSNG